MPDRSRQRDQNDDPENNDEEVNPFQMFSCFFDTVNPEEAITESAPVLLSVQELPKAQLRIF